MAYLSQTCLIDTSQKNDQIEGRLFTKYRWEIQDSRVVSSNGINLRRKRSEIKHDFHILGMYLKIRKSTWIVQRRQGRRRKKSAVLLPFPLSQWNREKWPTRKEKYFTLQLKWNFIPRFLFTDEHQSERAFHYPNKPMLIEKSLPFRKDRYFPCQIFTFLKCFPLQRNQLYELNIRQDIS